MPQRRIYARLIASEAVTALVPAECIRPILLRQGDPLPAITYQVVSRVPENHAGGTTNCGAARIQIDVWAETYAGAKEVADAVRTALSGWSEDREGMCVTMCLVEGEQDMPEQGDPGEDAMLHRVSFDFMVEFVEP